LDRINVIIGYGLFVVVILTAIAILFLSSGCTGTGRDSLTSSSNEVDYDTKVLWCLGACAAFRADVATDIDTTSKTEIRDKEL
jgi:hypothetical protein